MAPQVDEDGFTLVADVNSSNKITNNTNKNNELDLSKMSKKQREKYEKNMAIHLAMSMPGDEIDEKLMERIKGGNTNNNNLVQDQQDDDGDDWDMA